MGRLHELHTELRRRKVYRVAIAYGAVSLGVWQAAEFAFPRLQLPEASVTFVLALTLLGFPLALELAWAYELQPEQSGPGTAVDPPPTAAAASHGAAHRDAAVEPDTAWTSSIAVLPFENMSAEQESEYFADGISEELTHALGRMPRCGSRRAPRLSLSGGSGWT